MLSGLNASARYAKVIFNDEVLYATIQLYGAPFVPTHLCYAVEGIQQLVAGSVDELQSALGGQAFAAGAASDTAGDDTA